MHPENDAAARIEALRRSIEEIDARIVRLLAERFAHVRALGAAKHQGGLPVESAAREAELRALHRAAAERAGIDPALVARLFALVLERSKAEQRAVGRRPRRA
jgi:chorismate mutase